MCWIEAFNLTTLASADALAVLLADDEAKHCHDSAENSEHFYLDNHVLLFYFNSCL